MAVPTSEPGDDVVFLLAALQVVGQETMVGWPPSEAGKYVVDGAPLLLVSN